jgi:type IV pilus assembly protein PilW
LHALHLLVDDSLNTYRKVRPNTNIQSGIGLIELMVSAVISLLLISAVIGLHVSSTSAYTTQINHVHNQEQSRIAFSFISRDIRMAGYFGCLSSTSLLNSNLNVDNDGNLFDSKWSLEGIENASATPSWLPSNHSATALNVRLGTDAITIRYADSTETAFLQFDAEATGSINAVDKGNKFTVGNIVILSDCDKGDLFQVSNEPSSSNILEHAVGGISPGNLTSILGGVSAAEYEASPNGPSQVSKYYAVRYYIRNTDLSDSTSPPGLYRSYVSDQGKIYNSEVIAGIENLQFLYGEDTDGSGTPNTYVKASAVGNWRNIISVQIGILARSIEQYGFESEQRQAAGGDFGSYILLDETITIGNNSRYQRAEYSTTVFIRNKL